ncbi:MAG: hypothetical protein GEU86_02410 [Actinophytocola sp.]|nr:hypothetical protein [Actinophytocola sp.]
MSAATRAQVELVLPDDERRSLLRVRWNGGWVGDLVFTSADERDGVLRALRAGDVSVVTRPVPRADFGIAGAQATPVLAPRDLSDV